ncbi:hypothetical protein O4J56_18975 [Nocardiopsis sp. RSe5-2]|uniref:Uncharacterized protein n=1 Tax=Nocardiopsis endophytica TaxID=3018445 RepID=A0ABT4U7N1_9ACTN|nr:MULTISPECIES: hypothetical protein [Nocardiopsis]MDA2812736.1 hypothetical protein [Nocardiopsis endophytica]
MDDIPQIATTEYEAAITRVANKAAVYGLRLDRRPTPAGQLYTLTDRGGRVVASRAYLADIQSALRRLGIDA